MDRLISYYSIYLGCQNSLQGPQQSWFRVDTIDRNELGNKEGLNLHLKQNLERFHKGSLGLRKKRCTDSGAQGQRRTVQGAKLTSASVPATKVLKTSLKLWRMWSYLWILNKKSKSSNSCTFDSAVRYRIQFSFSPKQSYVYLKTLNEV